MEISIISFTKRGETLSEKVWACLRGRYECLLFTKRENAKENITYVAGPLQDWSAEQFSAHRVLIFIGACGIAVRSIASSMQNKFIDSPVIVMDEAGEYVVPVVSGRYAGAVIIARQIAKAINAAPVITAATEEENPFVVDAFAVANDLWIDNHASAAKISAGLSERRITTMSIASGTEGRIPEEIVIHPYPLEYDVDILISAQRPKKYAARLQLVPHSIVLGINCKNGPTEAEVEQFILSQLEALRIPVQAMRALATVDYRREEKGLLDFAEKYGLLFSYETAETLAKVRGTFSASKSDQEESGVANICERAAMYTAGAFGKLLLPEVDQGNMMLAIAEKPWNVKFGEI